MNKINQETKLLVISVMIVAVVGLAVQSLTKSQTAEAIPGGGCDIRPDGTNYGSGGHNTVNSQTGEATISGGGTSNPDDPTQGGSGGRCVYNIYAEGANCVGNRSPP
jgi:hypothetical protein